MTRARDARLVLPLILLAGAVGAGTPAADPDPSGMAEQVATWAEANPSAWGTLRDKVSSLMGSSGADLEVVEGAVGDWLKAHAPQIAKIRSMGAPGATDQQIMESLELRHELLQSLMGPLQQGVDSALGSAPEGSLGVFEGFRQGVSRFAGLFTGGGDLFEEEGSQPVVEVVPPDPGHVEVSVAGGEPVRSRGTGDLEPGVAVVRSGDPRQPELPKRTRKVFRDLRRKLEPGR